MASGASIKNARQSGQRRDSKHNGKSLLAPTLGVHTSDLGEHRLNVRQIHALESMFTTHPAVQAARTVLHSQLLSGGVKLMRNGEAAKPVKFGERNDDGSAKKGITKDFQTHLDNHWLPFARDVVDCFLKWGLAPVVFEEIADDTHTVAIENLKREVGMTTRDSKSIRKRNRPQVLVPHVPQLGTYDIAWAYNGRYGYTREYVLYNNAPGNATRLDPAAIIHIRQHPDSVGNVNSPLATVYEQASFVSGITELAFTAELARAQPSIVTQMRKSDKQADLTAGSLFFDAESRAVADNNDGEDSTAQARQLEMQAQLMRVINNLQTRSQGTGSSSAAPQFTAPDVQPKLFVLPKEQELAPHVQVPQPRGDLEALMRLSIDQFCSALGVPASLVFEGKFSNNSTVQLQLLNSTVSQLAKAVNAVLTKTYNLLYDDEDGEEPAQLMLITAPLAAADEIEKLYTAQLIDYESALPAALYALGATAEEIEAAVKRAKEKEEKKCQCEDEDRDLNKQEAELNLQERKTLLKSNGEKAKLEVEQAKANVEKTKKDVANASKTTTSGDSPSE